MQIKNHHAFFVNVTGSDGVSKTLVIGDKEENENHLGVIYPDESLSGHRHVRDSKSLILPIANLPEGVYATKIVECNNNVRYLIDSNKDLWVWGYIPEKPEWYSDYCQEDDEDDGKGGIDWEKPCLFKWFKDKNLKALDVCGDSYGALLKFKDTDTDKEYFYSLPLTTSIKEDDHQMDDDGS